MHLCACNFALRESATVFHDCKVLCSLHFMLESSVLVSVLVRRGCGGPWVFT